MAATSSSASGLPELLARLEGDFPTVRFRRGRQNFWSGQHRTVTYNPRQPLPEVAWSLFHELSHAQLEHLSYTTDFELLNKEAHAWRQASQIAQQYGYNIDQNYIEDCLDTYRDWLHKRSTCPTCQTGAPQLREGLYRCVNCSTEWRVSSRLTRPYRKIVTTDQ